MISVTVLDDIIWEKCTNCEDLVATKVEIGPVAVKLCKYCIVSLAKTTSAAAKAVKLQEQEAEEEVWE